MNSLGDPIELLPTEESSPNPQEVLLLDTYFKKNDDAVAQTINKTKDFIVLLVLFVLFSLPIGDKLIMKLTSENDSVYTRIGIKAILFTAIYFLYMNADKIRRK